MPQLTNQAKSQLTGLQRVLKRYRHLQFVLAVIEHATRRIRILGATPHPTAAWVV